jgi:hypothetical protein
MSSLNIIQDHVAPQSIIDQYAPFPLKGMHEFKDVPYIITDMYNNVRCRLCEDYICFNSFQEHVATFRHRLRYLQLEQGRKLYLTNERNRRLGVISDTVVDRIQNLNSASAKSHLNDLAFQYIYSPNAMDMNNPSSNSMEERRRWLALDEQLALYEEAEKKDAEDHVVVNNQDDAPNTSSDDLDKSL